MKSDFDSLMAEREIDAFVIVGNGTHNPPIQYMTKGAIVATSLVVLKKKGEEPFLIYNSMERDNVLKTGLKLQTFHEAIPDYIEILKQETNPTLISAKCLKSLFNHQGIEGTISIHGFKDLNYAHQIISYLTRNNGVNIYSGIDDIITNARQTKDFEEIEQIKQVSEKTGKIIASVRTFFEGLNEEDGFITNSDGKRVLLGEIKKLISLQLFENGLVEDTPTIFSIGRDAGVPHNHGNAKDFLKAGTTIIMDIFPKQPNGYYFDCTRTFSLGYAPEEVEALYMDVLTTQEKVLEEINNGIPYGKLFSSVCEMFEEKGHPTLLSKQGITHGFFHGLGHGIGLEIHEEPRLGLSQIKDKDSVVRPGDVFTVEPGLYYPDKGMGVRLEDVVAMTEDGPQNLSPFPKDLVVPLRK